MRIKIINTIPLKLVIRRLFLPFLSIKEEATTVPAPESNTSQENLIY
jgi:hypothetical protein